MKPLTFPRARRITQTADFQRVREDGESVRGSLLTLGYLRDEREKHSRFGFVTAKRLGGAVTRNRVRRRLRDIVRHRQHEIVPGVLIITIAKSRAARATHAELADEWLHLARRASILSA